MASLTAWMYAEITVHVQEAQFYVAIAKNKSHGHFCFLEQPDALLPCD